jgi:hypothetical protein
MVYIKRDYDRPKRSDYYLMQIAQEVRRVLHKQPRKVLLKDFRLDFSGKPSKTSIPLRNRVRREVDDPKVIETRERAKAKWRALIQLGSTEKPKPK